MKHYNNSRIAGAMSLIQRTFFDICLIIKISLTRVENNSLEWTLLLLLIVITSRRRRRINEFDKHNNVVI